MPVNHIAGSMQNQHNSPFCQWVRANVPGLSAMFEHAM
jgi:hypothetical protein